MSGQLIPVPGDRSDNNPCPRCIGNRRSLESDCPTCGWRPLPPREPHLLMLLPRLARYSKNIHLSQILIGVLWLGIAISLFTQTTPATGFAFLMLTWLSVCIIADRASTANVLWGASAATYAVGNVVVVYYLRNYQELLANLWGVTAIYRHTVEFHQNLADTMLVQPLAAFCVCLIGAIAFSDKLNHGLIIVSFLVVFFVSMFNFSLLVGM